MVLSELQPNSTKANYASRIPVRAFKYGSVTGTVISTECGGSTTAENCFLLANLVAKRTLRLGDNAELCGNYGAA